MNYNVLQIKFVFTIIIPLCFLPFIICNESNLINREIEAEKEKEMSKEQGVYLIKDDITSIYKAKEISLFISIIDCSLRTKLTFLSTIANYSSNYHLLLGETKYYYPLHQNLKSKPQYHNSITNETKTLKLEDDVFVHKSTVDYQNMTVHLFLLRNQFSSQFNFTKSPNGKSTNLKFLDFYDLNVIINTNQQTIDFNTKTNVLFLNNTDNIINANETISLLSKNTYEIIFQNELIKEKIKRIQAIDKALEVLLNKQFVTINLYNFLLSSQVSIIKSLVENLQKSLLPLISFPLQYSDQVFNIKLEQLLLRANKVNEYISQYDFSSSDKAIYVAYYFFFIALLSIGGYFVFLTAKEFRIAYQKKIK